MGWHKQGWNRECVASVPSNFFSCVWSQEPAGWYAPAAKNKKNPELRCWLLACWVAHAGCGLGSAAAAGVELSLHLKPNFPCGGQLGMLFLRNQFSFIRPHLFATSFRWVGVLGVGLLGCAVGWLSLDDAGAGCKRMQFYPKLPLQQRQPFHALNSAAAAVPPRASSSCTCETFYDMIVSYDWLISVFARVPYPLASWLRELAPLVNSFCAPWRTVPWIAHSHSPSQVS